MNDGSDLNGNLEFLTLGDILQLLGSNGCTGTLRLKSKYAPDPAEIYMSKGNPINGRNGSLTGLDAVNSLFGWTVGHFEFESGDVRCEAVIKKSRMSIILDSLSMLDEGAIEKLGPISYTQEDKSASKAVLARPIIKGPLVDYMYVVDEESFEAGQEITIEGKHGNWIWVVMEGSVEIVKQIEEETVTLLEIHDGAFIGSTASFLMGGNVRGASAFAKEDVQLGILDSQQLAGEFALMSSNLRGLVISLDRRLRELTNQAVSLYKGVNPTQKWLDGKKPVIKQGAQEDQIFMITKGEACVVGKTKKGYLPIATLREGDFYGRVPFLDFGHEPEAASVVGSEDLAFSVIDPKELSDEFGKLSTTFKNLLEHTVTCIAVTSKLAGEFLAKHTSAKPKKK